MKPLVVLMIWTRLKQAEIVSFVMNMISKMTGNPNFAEPAVKLEDMNKATQLYAETYGNRLNGKNARAEFKTAKASLFVLLRQQALYINSVVAKSSDVNVQDEIITSAGLESTKNSKSKKITPAQPKAPTVSYENGDVKVSIPAIKSATSYLWIIFLSKPFDVTVAAQQLIIDQTAKFILIPAGKSREVLSNVPTRSDIYVQVLAQNTAGKSAFSPVIDFHTGG